jgi:hypothetical protein
MLSDPNPFLVEERRKREIIQYGAENEATRHPESNLPHVDCLLSMPVFYF